MKLSLSLIFFLLLFVDCFAQAPPIEWQKNFGGNENIIGEKATCVQPTNDGGYIVAGYAYSTDGDVVGLHGKADYWILKLNSAGSIQWQKTLGGSQDDYAYSIKQTPDGGYVVAGWTGSNDGDVSGYHGLSGADFWVVKLSSIGNIEWQKCYGGTSTDVALSMDLTPNGIVVAGYTLSNDGDVSGNHATNAADYWVILINDLGTLVWQKCLGSSFDDRATSVRYTPDGGFIVAGRGDHNSGDITGNHGGPDFWVVKLNGSGVIQWQKSLGGSGVDFPNSISLTADGGYIVAGSSSSHDGNVFGNHSSANPSSSDYWVVKLGSTGSVEWQKCLGGNDIDVAYSVRPTSDGGYIVAGGSNSNDGDVGNHFGNTDYWIVKLDENGQLVWQHSYGGNGIDEPSCIEPTVDGGYVISGFTNSGIADGNVTNNHIGNDYWIVKLGAAPCTPNITISASADSICAGAPVTFVASPANQGTAPHYQWQINGVNVGSSKDSFMTSSLSNNDIVTCTLTSNAACGAASATVISNVISIPVKNNLQPSVSIIASDTNFCQGTLVSFTAQASNAGPSPVYQWKLNGNPVGSTGSSYSNASLPAGAQVSCVVQASLPGCPILSVSSAPIQLTVNPLPSATVFPTDTLILKGSSLQFHVTASGYNSWSWEPPSLLVNPLSLSPSTVPVFADALLQLHLQSQAGCLATQTIRIKVYTPFYMPDAFTPNGDGLNDVFGIPPGVLFTLKRFSIYNRWGARVFSSKDINQGWDGTLKGIKQPTGVYVYLIEGENEKGNFVYRGSLMLIR